MKLKCPQNTFWITVYLDAVKFFNRVELQIFKYKVIHKNLRVELQIFKYKVIHKNLVDGFSRFQRFVERVE
jgi:hypothetical protein